MFDESKKEFYVLMKGCTEIYRQDLTDAIVSIFWEMLKIYEIEKVKAGFSSYLRNPKNLFFPKPAQIIEEIEGRKEDKALQAWSKALNAKLEFGFYRSVVFDDLIIHDVVSDFGGWVKFCGILDNENSLSFTSKEFCRRYEGYLDGWALGEKKVLLGGEAMGVTRYNQQHEPGSRHWQELPAPAFVGSRLKAEENFLRIKNNEKLKLSDMRNDGCVPATLPLVRDRSFNHKLVVSCDDVFLAQR